MLPSTAPGPNDLPPIFYQHYWDKIGGDVAKAVLTWLNSSTICPSFNHTYITLIPKVKCLQQVTEFRPIALCNILYKFVSKVLANRLKKLLPDIISESQSAFQFDKAISNNILVAFESLHHMKHKKVGKSGFMAMKLDMSKAYECVEWNFLCRLMEKMGFVDRWIQLIYSCISSVSYSILVNGEPCGDIRPTRGLRQGDPLSPYLFILVFEGLNGLIQQAMAAGDIRGFSLCRNGPRISHSFFADDTLLFCRAKFREIKEYECYLGLPAVVGKNRRASLNYIKERIWSKLQGLKEKILSQAGREVLLKAVVQAIPTFAMSCFKIPVGLCNDIEAMIQKFWWGQRGDRRKIHWKKWDILCLPKSKGGLGFQELGKFIEAMLSKQVWRLVHDTESLFYRVFKVKYFPTGSIFDAKAGSGWYAWRSILKARKVVLLGARWRIGNGSSVKIFKDSWLLGTHSGRVLSPVSVLLEEATVDLLIDRDSRWWNTNLVDLIFIPSEAQLIKSIMVCHSTQKDFLFWPPSRTGMYQVHTGYHLLYDLQDNEVASSSDTAGQEKFWNSLWKLNIPNKVKFFLWRACTDSIPNMLNLHKRKIVPSSGQNKLRVGEVVWPLNKVAGVARRHLQEFQQVRRCPNKKANFDGAIFEDLRAAGIGVALRNEHGEVVAALAEQIPIPHSVFTLETLAARHAILFVRELGFRNVVFEGDSKSSIQAISNRLLLHSSCGHIIHDILLFASSLQSFSFSHVCRRGNALADALAKRARLSSPLLV
ncbi:uncharacterized protein LOC142605854 [Castanea sativa]|uniref:uncharacterized protein LOC142605854 n=1 Tax=Castanea sativa TaxID=21020 RepID=UPI003F6531A5